MTLLYKHLLDGLKSHCFILYLDDNFSVSFVLFIGSVKNLCGKNRARELWGGRVAICFFPQCCSNVKPICYMLHSVAANQHMSTWGGAVMSFTGIIMSVKNVLCVAFCTVNV